MRVVGSVFSPWERSLSCGKVRLFVAIGKIAGPPVPVPLYAFWKGGIRLVFLCLSLSWGGGWHHTVMVRFYIIHYS